MKKKKKILIICFSLFFVLSFVVISVKTVDADSGWDSSYDSGGSSDWGDSDWGDSDWGDSDWGDSDYDSTGRGSIYSYLMPAFVITFFLVYAIKERIKSLNNARMIVSDKMFEISNSFSKTSIYNSISEEKINEYGLNKVVLENMAIDIYKQIQIAWMNFDYKTLRKYTTDEMYNSYVMQLEALKLKKQKNVMKDFEFLSVKIYDIKEENGVLNIEVYMNVLMYDYVESVNGMVLRGNDKRRINIEYELTFVKTSEKITKTTLCPNCGAKIEKNASSKCGYCGSVIVSKSNNFVMSRKICIGQRME